MGKKAKEHRKRVAKRAEKLKLKQKKIQKLFDVALKQRLEQSQTTETTTQNDEES